MVIRLAIWLASGVYVALRKTHGDCLLLRAHDKLSFGGFWSHRRHTRGAARKRIAIAHHSAHTINGRLIGFLISLVARMGGTFGGYSVRPAVSMGRRATPITLPGRETF
jgi:hypothetical protein